MTAQSRRIPVTAETLAGVFIFEQLTREQRADIAGGCHAFGYPAESEIVSHNDATTDVYFVVSGKVRATQYSFAGKKVSFRDIGAGEVFGELAAIDGQPRTANVVTLTESLIGSMSAEAFKSTLMMYPEVAWISLQQMTHLVRYMTNRVVEFSTLGVTNRIHAELLRLARTGLEEDGSAVISPVPTDDEIASRISTRREAVNRELRQLEKIGLIERAPRSRIIRDVQRLERMVKEVIGE
jgi:CRP-like cAMP-binding protein